MSTEPALEVSVSVDRREFRLDVELDLANGRRLALVGPSGAGKTSVLRTIAGLTTPEAGLIAIAGQTCFDSRGGVDLPPEHRRCGYVSQDYSLFPHMTVTANVVFGMRRGRAAERRQRAVVLLERLGIEQLADAAPARLSGGERQRVALARALATEPALFLFDEPLAALDPRTRDLAIPVIDEVLRETGTAALIVTHSRAEAERLADQTVLIERGRVSDARDHEHLRPRVQNPVPDSGRSSVSIHRVIRQ